MVINGYKWLEVAGTVIVDSKPGFPWGCATSSGFLFQL